MPLSVPQQLASEIRRLGAGENAQPVAMFTLQALEAYSMVALLQLVLRHPHLSDTQRAIADGFAHQIADQLVNAARSVLGPWSAIETTLELGFSEQFDVAAHPEAGD